MKVTYLRSSRCPLRSSPPVVNATGRSSGRSTTSRMSRNVEKPFKCNRCAKSFAKNDYLTTHIRDVHSQKSYPCPKCTKEFASKHYLLDHQAVHSVRPVICNICGINLKSKQTFQKHRREMHSASLKFCCTRCQKAFPRSDYLKNHIKKVHLNQRYPCDHLNCNKTFTLKANLTRHSRLHKSNERRHNGPKRSSESILIETQRSPLRDLDDDLSSLTFDHPAASSTPIRPQVNRISETDLIERKIDCIKRELALVEEELNRIKSNQSGRNQSSEFNCSRVNDHQFDSTHDEQNQYSSFGIESDNDSLDEISSTTTMTTTIESSEEEEEVIPNRSIVNELINPGSTSSPSLACLRSLRSRTTNSSEQPVTSITDETFKCDSRRCQMVFKRRHMLKRHVRDVHANRAVN